MLHKKILSSCDIIYSDKLANIRLMAHFDIVRLDLNIANQSKRFLYQKWVLNIFACFG